MVRGRAGDRYRLKDGLWQALGREDLVPQTFGLSTSRTPKVEGTYEPGFFPNDQGYRKDWALEDFDHMYALGSTGSNRRVQFGSSYEGDTVKNKIIWGAGWMQAPGVTFDNCIFAGQELTTRVTEGCIKSYGDNYHQANFIDCTVDPSLWLSPVAPISIDATTWGANNTPNTGVHGGRVKMTRCEIRNVSDGMQSIMSSSGAPYDDYVLEMLDSLIWMGWYVRDTASPWLSLPEGTHCDAVQFSLGKNYHFRNTKFGGTRVNSALLSTLPYIHGGAPSLDYFNAGHLIHQEGNPGTWTDYGRALGNMLTEFCFFDGGVSGINMYYDSSNPNTMPDWLYENNYFKVRADYGTTQDQGAPGGTDPTMRYIVRGSQFASNFTNNRLYTVNPDGTFNVGGLVPITTG